MRTWPVTSGSNRSTAATARSPRPTLTAISNVRRGSGEAREEEATAILWTLWGKQAENAAEYLGKGSHVNVVGRVRNNNYEKDGETVYGLAFTCEEIDYLDTKADARARARSRHEFVDEMNAAEQRCRARRATAPRPDHATRELGRSSASVRSPHPSRNQHAHTHTGHPLCATARACCAATIR